MDTFFDSFAKNQPRAKPHLRLIVRSAVDQLRKTRSPQSLEEIFSEMSVFGEKLPLDSDIDISRFKENFDSHPNVRRVDASGGLKYLYKPKLENISCEKDIIKHLKNNKNGVFESDYHDAYNEAKEDLKKMERQKQLVSIKASNSTKNVLFYLPETRRKTECEEILVQLWDEVVTPHQNALRKMEEELTKHGHVIKPIAKKRKIIPKKKASQQKKKRRYKVNLTNSHLKNKFEIFKQIDEDC